jgi:hypothetical protein
VVEEERVERQRTLGARAIVDIDPAVVEVAIDAFALLLGNDEGGVL